ncbi:MAG: hypothetical protein WBN60_05410, partial [Polyangiales bacterium]
VYAEGKHDEHEWLEALLIDIVLVVGDPGHFGRKGLAIDLRVTTQKKIPRKRRHGGDSSYPLYREA